MISPRSSRQFLILGFLCLMFGLTTHHAFAQVREKGKLEVSPAYIDVDLTPKDAVQMLDLTYTNHTDSPMTIQLFPLDFHQTSPFGNIGFLSEDDGSYSYSLASFLSFETDRLDLAPGEKKTLHVQASSRQDLSPGGHYAAIIAKQIENASGETVLSPAVSTLVYLRKVGGERFNLSLLDVSWPGVVSLEYPPTITVLFRNEGNVHLTPQGVMEVKDMFGRVVAKGILNEDSLKVLPESTRYLPIYLKRLDWSLPISIDTVTLRGNDSLHKVVFQRSDVVLYVHPLAIFVPLLLIGIWYALRRKGKGEKGK